MRPTPFAAALLLLCTPPVLLRAQEHPAPAKVVEKAGFGIAASVWPPEAGPGELVELRVVVTPAEGRYVYAMAQPKGFEYGLPLAVEVAVEGLEAVGEWRESTPHRKDDEVLKVSYDVHDHTAVLTRAYRVPAKLEKDVVFSFQGKVSGMSCNSQGCLPPSTLDFEAAAPARIGLAVPKIEVAAERGWGAAARLHRIEVEPGQTVWVSVWIASPTPRHIYSMHRPTEIGFPTRIALQLPGGMETAAPFAEPEPHVIVDEVLEETLYVHEGTVRFFAPIRVPADCAPGKHKLSVVVDAMSCDDEGCLPPAQQTLELELVVVGG